MLCIENDFAQRALDALRDFRNRFARRLAVAPQRDWLDPNRLAEI